MYESHGKVKARFGELCKEDPDRLRGLAGTYINLMDLRETADYARGQNISPEQAVGAFKEATRLVERVREHLQDRGYELEPVDPRKPGVQDRTWNGIYDDDNGGLSATSHQTRRGTEKHSEGIAPSRGELSPVGGEDPRVTLIKGPNRPTTEDPWSRS